MPTPDVRKRQGDVALSREEFAYRFAARFCDPAFDAVRSELDRIGEIAWEAYAQSRKSPRTRKAGDGFADPQYELSLEWLTARERIEEAERRQRDPSAPRRILLVSGSSRHEKTCPGEMPKSFRLAQIAREVVAGRPGFECDLLGYYAPYPTSHSALDRDEAVQEEVRNVARTPVAAVELMRDGRLLQPDAGVQDPRPK